MPMSIRQRRRARSLSERRPDSRRTVGTTQRRYPPVAVRVSRATSGDSCRRRVFTTVQQRPSRCGRHAQGDIRALTNGGLEETADDGGLIRLDVDRGNPIADRILYARHERRGVIHGSLHDVDLQALVLVRQVAQRPDHGVIAAVDDRDELGGGAETVDFSVESGKRRQNPPRPVR
jgi:hypothetical protein